MPGLLRVVPRERRDAEVLEVDQPDVQRVRRRPGGSARGTSRTALSLCHGVVVVAVDAGQREREAGVGGGAGLAARRRSLLSTAICWLIWRVGDVAVAGGVAPSRGRRPGPSRQACGLLLGLGALAVEAAGRSGASIARCSLGRDGAVVEAAVAAASARPPRRGRRRLDAGRRSAGDAGPGPASRRPTRVRAVAPSVTTAAVREQVRDAHEGFPHVRAARGLAAPDLDPATRRRSLPRVCAGSGLCIART